MLRASKIEKTFSQDASRGNSDLQILRGLDFEIHRGEAVCISGGSGAGKSTFLHILGTLDRPTKGQVFFNGENLFEQSDEQLARFRNEKIGFVFQFHHLLPEFTALENVMMPGRLAHRSAADCKSRAESLLVQFGLSDRLKHFPTELSGGEQQRVAIARALFNAPQLLLADEPTGNLDSKNGRAIQDLFFQLREEHQLTLIVVTHDQQFASRFPRQLKMADGHWIF